jgi:hypothetical protein
MYEIERFLRLDVDDLAQVKQENAIALIRRSHDLLLMAEEVLLELRSDRLED